MTQGSNAHLLPWQVDSEPLSHLGPQGSIVMYKRQSCYQETTLPLAASHSHSGFIQSHLTVFLPFLFSNRQGSSETFCTSYKLSNTSMSMSFLGFNSRISALFFSLRESLSTLSARIPEVKVPPIQYIETVYALTSSHRLQALGGQVSCVIYV